MILPVLSAFTFLRVIGPRPAHATPKLCSARNVLWLSGDVELIFLRRSHRSYNRERECDCKAISSGTRRELLSVCIEVCSMAERWAAQFYGDSKRGIRIISITLLCVCAHSNPPMDLAPEGMHVRCHKTFYEIHSNRSVSELERRAIRGADIFPRFALQLISTSGRPASRRPNCPRGSSKIDQNQVACDSNHNKSHPSTFPVIGAIRDSFPSEDFPTHGYCRRCERGAPRDAPRVLISRDLPALRPHHRSSRHKPLPRLSSSRRS